MERWIRGWCCASLALATLTADASQASADGGPGFPRTGTLPSGTDSVLSRDGSTLVVGDPAESRLLIYSRPAGGWGAPIGAPAAVTTGPPGTPVTIGDAVDVSDDGGVVITQGYSGAVRVLEIFQRPYTGWASGNLQAYGGGPVSGDLTVSGDGGTIATGNGGTGVSVWTRDSWGGYGWNSLGETPSRALDLPYDGSSLAVAGGTTAVHGIRAVAVLPRPSGGWDRSINAWPLPDARPGLFSFSTDIAYSGDGRTLVASGVNSDGALLYDGTGAPTLLTRPGGGAVQGDVALSADGATVTFTVGPWQGDVVTYAFLRPSAGWPDSLHETSAIVGPKTNGSGRSTVLADGEMLAISGSSELGLYSRDRTAPATSVAVPPADGRDGWHVRPVTVALAADDGLNGAGIGETRCALDPGSAPTSFEQLPPGPCPYPAGPTVTTSGPHSFYAASVDGFGNVGTLVSVDFQLDAVPPRLLVPAPFAVDAPVPGGTNVQYSYSASDDYATSVPVACAPSPGAFFPVGVTTVRCNAIDQAGNVAEAAFDVTVRGEPLPRTETPVRGDDGSGGGGPGGNSPGGSGGNGPGGGERPAPRPRLSGLALRGRVLSVRVSAAATVRAELARCTRRRRGGKPRTSCVRVASVNASAARAGTVTAAGAGEARRRQLPRHGPRRQRDAARQDSQAAPLIGLRLRVG